MLNHRLACFDSIVRFTCLFRVVFEPERWFACIALWHYGIDQYTKIERGS